jgi:hypothetical protein
MKCGREQGGTHMADLGVCPSYKLGAGDACWMIAGTFCGGTVQGSFAQKQNACMSCQVFKAYDMAHKGAAQRKWKNHLTA